MILRLLSVALLVFAAALGAGPAWGQTCTQVAQDDFNRASLGANWQQVNALDAGSIATFSSLHFRGPNASNYAAARWVGTGTFSSNQCSIVTVNDNSFGDSEYGVGAAVRMSADATSPTRDYYEHRARSNGTSQILKVVNGTETQIGVATGITWSSGNTLEIHAEGDETSTTVRIYRNGALLTSAVDSSTPLTGGVPGITGAGGIAQASGTHWVGGDLGAAASGPPLRSLLGVGQ